MATVAEILAADLKRAGVRWAAGHPGGEVAHLLDALRRADVPFHLTHHEVTAGLMADAHGFLTGRPGLCVSTLGPGATNMVTGAAHALLDRAPVLAVTAELSTSAPRGTTHQNLELNALYRPVTKESMPVTAETVVGLVDRAAALATTDRPGPVHLSLPSDVAAVPAVERASARRPADAAASPADPAAVARARTLLAAARRPAIVAGLGAVQHGAAAALRRLVEGHRIPFATTPKAKGIVPEDHPLHFGVVEMAGDDLVIEQLSSADLILAVGLDVVEFDKPWRTTSPVVLIDGLPNRDQYFPSEVDLIGPIAASLDRLAEADRPAGDWSEAALTAHRAALVDYVRAPGAGLTAADVVLAARRVAPRSAIATSDVGAHKMVVGQLWQAYEPRTFLMSNGLSSMGYGLASAMAAKLLDPARPVLALVGDGGLAMYLGELETAVRLGLPLVVVVLVDGSLTLIEMAQRRRGYAPLGVHFANPDFAQVAKAFGASGVVVDSAPACAAAIERGLAASGVTLVAARIDGAAYRM